jgi:hypothetical protein
MNHAQQKKEATANMAMNYAIEILKSIGAIFTVQSPDGQTITNAKKKAQRPKKYSFGHFKIAETFANAIPGKPMVFHAGDIPLINLRGRLTGEASRIFGNGNYTTTIDRGQKTVTVVVGAPAKPLAAEIAKSIRTLNQSKGRVEFRPNV